MKIANFLSAGILALALTAPAHADIITWTITGHIQGTYDPYGDLVSAGVSVNAGDPFALTYTFNTSILPNQNYTNVHAYGFNIQNDWNLVAGRGSLALTVGGNTWSGDNSYSRSYSNYYFDGTYGNSNDELYANANRESIHLSGNSPYTYDYGTGFTSPVFGEPASGDYYHQANAYFDLWNYINSYMTPPPASVLNGQWPNTIDLSAFPNSNIGVYQNLYTYDCSSGSCNSVSNQNYSFWGTAETFSSSVDAAVPAPGALALLGLGLLGLGAVRRRAA